MFFNWYTGGWILTDMNRIFIIRHQVKKHLMKYYQITSVLPHALHSYSFSPHIYLYYSFESKSNRNTFLSFFFFFSTSSFPIGTCISEGRLVSPPVIFSLSPTVSIAFFFFFFLT